MIPERIDRHEKALAAQKAGEAADAVFANACRKLGLVPNEAMLAPLDAVAIAAAERVESVS